MHPSSLAVIGLGAIGGSLAWQARLAGVDRVVGYSPLPAEGIQALKAGAITELADTPPQAARGAEIVVLAVPPQATLELIGSLASALAPGSVLTDVCSVKEPIIRHAVASGLGDHFAGGHPLAGTHQTGFVSASADRLRGCVVYICETGTPAGHRAAAAVAGFWEHTLNASPGLIDPAAHDRQLAWTSHLPQAVAYALAKVLAEHGLGGVSFGSGAKDTTRLAASNPEMWVDILLLNRVAVVEALEQTRAGLQELQQLLSDEERGALLRFCDIARSFRLGIDR
ncbi:MAG TPA: prephenate dehydrogenase/arogenate dehydrogenase family protein [Gemmatimonadales bacterium]|nr:prephenate dehydrogenase/arogenate dehydrogenase family protein [Gemmatimonadales bacterium]